MCRRRQSGGPIGRGGHQAGTAPVPAGGGRGRSPRGRRRPGGRVRRLLNPGGGEHPVGQRVEAAGRQPEGGAHRGLGLGHPRPAQWAHLSRHGPGPVAVPAAAAAEHRGADGVRAGRRDQPARVDVGMGDPAAPRHHLPRREAADRRRRHLHADPDRQGQVHRLDSPRPGRREGPEGDGQAHRPGADDQSLRQFRRPAGVLVLPLRRAHRLQSEAAERYRAVQVPELHPRPAQRVHQEPQLLEIGTPLRRYADDHRLQRQRQPAERAGHRRHPRRRRAGGPADLRAEKQQRRAHRRFAHRRDHAVHHARGPGTVQRRQRPPGDAAAGRPAAAWSTRRSAATA